MCLTQIDLHKRVDLFICSYVFQVNPDGHSYTYVVFPTNPLNHMFLLYFPMFSRISLCFSPKFPPF